MKRILFLGAVEKFFNSKMISSVISDIQPEFCALLVHEKSEQKIFEKFGECYFRENIVNGLYQDEELDMQNCYPLEDDVLNYMSSYTLEILNQQRRFEEYHDFHVSATLENHYMIYMHNLFFWNDFLVRKQITHVFMTCIPHEGYDSIIYHLCKKYDIPVMMVYNTFFPSRQYALSDYLKPENEAGKELERLKIEYADTEEIPLEEEALRMYQKWSSLESEKMRPYYMEGNPFERRVYNRLGEMSVYRACKSVLSGIYKKYDYQFCIHFVGDCFKNIPAFGEAIAVTLKRWKYGRKIKQKALKLNEYYNSIAEMPVNGEKYVYFALHYQPEASSNPLGGVDYADQLLPINILSRALPDDVKIYVKTHPEQMALLRSKDYYDDLRKIDKVRVIKSECDTYSLMKNAFAVSSLTGTVCWEAQFFGIPAIVFGYSHKSLAPISYFVRTVDECKRAVEKIENRQNEIPSKELKLLVKAVYNISFDEKEMEERLPKMIIEFINNN